MGVKDTKKKKGKRKPCDDIPENLKNRMIYYKRKILALWKKEKDGRRLQDRIVRHPNLKNTKEYDPEKRTERKIGKERQTHTRISARGNSQDMTQKNMIWRRPAVGKVTHREDRF